LRSELGSIRDSSQQIVPVGISRAATLGMVGKFLHHSTHAAHARGGTSRMGTEKYGPVFTGI
ncbi:MAG: hypothetical protein AB7T49_19570, partial [Oligoflexales bacterium]